MNTEIVYICYASTGEYSDRSEFALHGYRCEENAKAFVERSDKLFRERWKNVLAADKTDGLQYKERCRRFTPGWHPECPTLDVPDYTGYLFWYEAVEVK